MRGGEHGRGVSVSIPFWEYGTCSLGIPWLCYVVWDVARNGIVMETKSPSGFSSYIDRAGFRAGFRCKSWELVRCHHNFPDRNMMLTIIYVPKISSPLKILYGESITPTWPHPCD